MKLRISGRPLASIACLTAPSAAPVPDSSRKTRVRLSDGRIDRSRSAAPFVPTGGLAPFLAISAGNARPVIEPLGAGFMKPDERLRYASSPDWRRERKSSEIGFDFFVS